MKRYHWIVVVILITISSLLVTYLLVNFLFFKKYDRVPAPLAQTGDASVVLPTFKVAKVIDGDTLKLSDGRLVRYIGIDAPETVDPARPVQCFGKEASDKNRALVEGKRVTLVKGTSETDQYGRLLRYVYVGGTFINDLLVRSGFAKADNFPPDEKFKGQLKAAQLEAKTATRGLWAPNACKN